jgi:hypothetical protein
LIWSRVHIFIKDTKAQIHLFIKPSEGISAPVYLPSDKQAWSKQFRVTG